MLSVTKLIPGSRGLAQALLQRAASLELDWATRCASEFKATDSHGRHLEVRLAAGQVLRGGDCLVASDGSLIGVRCASQAVTVARPGADAQGLSALLSAAYRLGSDRVAVDARSDRLLILPDAARAAQLQAQGLVLSEENDAFEPLDAAASPKPRASIAIAPAAAAPAHVHGPGCGHHGHDHHSH